jgi:hypothetical protein
MLPPKHLPKRKRKFGKAMLRRETDAKKFALDLYAIVNKAYTSINHKTWQIKIENYNRLCKVLSDLMRDLDKFEEATNIDNLCWTEKNLKCAVQTLLSLQSKSEEKHLELKTNKLNKDLPKHTKSITMEDPLQQRVQVLYHGQNMLMKYIALTIIFQEAFESVAFDYEVEILKELNGNKELDDNKEQDEEEEEEEAKKKLTKCWAKFTLNAFKQAMMKLHEKVG